MDLCLLPILKKYQDQGFVTYTWTRIISYNQYQIEWERLRGCLTDTLWIKSLRSSLRHANISLEYFEGEVKKCMTRDEIKRLSWDVGRGLLKAAMCFAPESHHGDLEDLILADSVISAEKAVFQLTFQKPGVFTGKFQREFELLPW